MSAESDAAVIEHFKRGEHRLNCDPDERCSCYTPVVEVREVETWWWHDSPRHSYGTTEALARRAQSIFGGEVRVIRQTITTVTTTTVTSPVRGTEEDS